MKIKHILLIISFFLVIIACKKDFIERPPIDKLTAANFYTNAEELAAGTTMLYNTVWQNYNDKCMYSIGDARAYNVCSNDRNTYYMFIEEASHIEIRQMWSSLYNTVGQCNMTILNVNTFARENNVEESAIDYALGEAHFFRAMAYFFLVTTYGEVPIIYNNTKQMIDTTLAPNTIPSIWDFILRDMNYAVDHLSETPINVGRLDKWGAKGMLSKFYLYHSGLGHADGNRDQSELDSAYKYAQDVIYNSSYDLMDNYYDLFLTANENSKESMVALQFVALDDDKIKNTFQAYVAYEPKITGTGDGWGSAQGASLDMMKYFVNEEPNDLRRKAIFMFPLDTFPEILQEEGGYVFTADQSQGEDDRPNSTLAAIKKYVVGTPEDNDGQGVLMGTGINSYMLRLAEVYLIYAESILGNNVSTSDPEALTYINKIRSRAGIDSLESVTWMDIFKEKRIECALEGVTWYDIVRWSYFAPDDALNFVANQEKGGGASTGYTIVIDTTAIPAKYELILKETNRTYSPGSIEGFYLPYPNSEESFSNLLKNPVDFDFSVLGEDD